MEQKLDYDEKFTEKKGKKGKGNLKYRSSKKPKHQKRQCHNDNNSKFYCLLHGTNNIHDKKILEKDAAKLKAEIKEKYVPKNSINLGKKFIH